MLKALANQLRNLATEDEAGFRECIRKRLGGGPTDEQVKAVKEFIFLLPPVLQQLSDYWSDEACPSQAKKLSVRIITYIYSPDDYLPEEEHGLFGYLDDAYLVVSAFLRQAAAAREDGRAFLVGAGKELAILLGGELNRLNAILRRIRQ